MHLTERNVAIKTTIKENNMRPYVLSIKDPILLTIRKVIVFATSTTEAKKLFKEQYKEYVSHSVINVQEQLNGD